MPAGGGFAEACHVRWCGLSSRSPHSWRRETCHFSESSFGLGLPWDCHSKQEGKEADGDKTSPAGRALHTCLPFHWEKSCSWVRRHLSLPGWTRLAEAGRAGLQGVEPWPGEAMPRALLFPPLLTVPEGRSHNNRRSSSLAAWYLILSTDALDSSQKPTLPPTVKRGRWGEAPRPPAESRCP